MFSNISELVKKHIWAKKVPVIKLWKSNNTQFGTALKNFPSEHEKLFSGFLDTRIFQAVKFLDAAEN